MSQATKRKHVVKEVLGDFVTPTEDQQIVKVCLINDKVAPSGDNTQHHLPLMAQLCLCALRLLAAVATTSMKF